tara:strand:+ start:38247 stop:38666 length:420 start_codon:yes stop_codon:yes gene_type:complete
MGNSYLERAKFWVQESEDVDIEALESTLFRFIQQLKKITNDTLSMEINDLNNTIQYLEAKLNELLGNESNFVNNTIALNSSSPPNIENFIFDPSPLVKVDSDTVPVALSKEQKEYALARIASTPGIISAKSLLKTRNIN